VIFENPNYFTVLIEESFFSFLLARKTKLSNQGMLWRKKN